MTNRLKDLFEVYRPKTKDEKDFVDKHVTIKHKDRNGNGDDVFQATNIKKSERKKERHGYEPGEDEKVYEAVTAHDKDGKLVGRYRDLETAKRLKPGHKYIKEAAMSVSDHADKHYDNWMHSEDAPMDDDAGDENAVHAKALSHLSGTNVPKEMHDDVAEKMTNKFHGINESWYQASAGERVAKLAHKHLESGMHSNIKDAIDHVMDIEHPKSKTTDSMRRGIKRVATVHGSKPMNEAEQIDEKDASHVKDSGLYGGPASKQKQKILSSFIKQNKNRKADAYYKEETKLKENTKKLPWKEEPANPTRKTGEERKDSFGNIVKNVPKFLAKKAMKANEAVEPDDTVEKNEMAQNQLHFLIYAAKEINEFIEMGGEIEEWYQNKLSKVHSDMEGLHSYIEGEKRRTGMVKESVTELSEGMMRLSKVHIVHHHDHPAAKEFAKNYTAGMKGDHREGGPTPADEKAANDFDSRYTGVRTRSGFAGSGTHVYTDHKTGAMWKVDRHPNGKTFYGTDHIISHVT